MITCLLKFLFLRSSASAGVLCTQLAAYMSSKDMRKAGEFLTKLADIKALDEEGK